jgi:hypothetical protein
LAAAIALLLAGCGSGGSAPAGEGIAQERHALETYIAEIEPLRRGADHLLDGADPILSAYSAHRITAAEAQHRMWRLERRFLEYKLGVAAVKPRPMIMAAADRAYAHTYVLEDTYLRALTNALPSRNWTKLPHYEHIQRRDIVAWRGQLAVQAARLHVRLPRDLSRAGVGEVVPSPNGD